ncbi:MAG: hypothetical protein ACLPWF_18740 [Bryobacteraceae bacterium]
MKITINTLTMVMPEENEEPAPPRYRLRKCLAAVQFDPPEKGRIVLLPEGTELCVVGTSRLSACLEVRCGRQRYHMFKVDLWGPWSAPVESSSAESNPIDSRRATVAVGARA